MRKKLLAPATTDQRPVFRLGLISAFLLLPVCLNGVISAGSPLRQLYAAGLVIALIQVICCVVRLRRGRQQPQADAPKP